MAEATAEPQQIAADAPLNGPQGERAMAEPVNSLPKVGGKLRFTPANARLFAARGLESKRQRKLARQAIDVNGPQKTVKQRSASDEYLTKRLVRVRKQLSKLDQLIESELDPQKLDRLASAQSRLSEQERILAGRPLPGSHRPTRNPKQSSTPTDFTPTE